jgi:hypothetical protein
LAMRSTLPSLKFTVVCTCKFTVKTCDMAVLSNGGTGDAQHAAINEVYGGLHLQVHNEHGL